MFTKKHRHRIDYWKATGLSTFAESHTKQRRQECYKSKSKKKEKYADKDLELLQYEKRNESINFFISNFISSKFEIVPKIVLQIVKYLPEIMLVFHWSFLATFSKWHICD